MADKFLDNEGLAYFWGKIKSYIMFGATANAAGRQGLVPTPEAGKQNMFLRGDGTWSLPEVGDAATVNGHTVEADVPSGAKFTDTVYTHPSYTAKDSGLYKVTVDATGHVSATTAVEKSDITALGIPGSDTNTWTENSKANNGYVTAGGTNANMVWKTDANGNPAWRADANTTYSATSPISLTNTTFSHANSGATAGTYGNATASPAHGGTFTIPRVTVNATGHVTSASSSTITLPSVTSANVTGALTYVPVKIINSTQTFSTSTNPQTFTIAAAKDYILVQGIIGGGNSIFADAHISYVNWFASSGTLKITRDAAASYGNTAVYLYFIKAGA